MVWPFGKKKKQSETTIKVTIEPVSMSAGDAFSKAKLSGREVMDRYFQLLTKLEESFARRCESPEARREAYEVANDMLVIVPRFAAQWKREERALYENPKREVELPNTNVFDRLSSLLAEDRATAACVKVCNTGEKLGFDEDWDGCRLSCDPASDEHHGVRRQLYYCYLRKPREAFDKSDYRKAIDRQADLNANLRNAPASRQPALARQLVDHATVAVRAMIAEEHFHREAAAAAEYKRDPKPLPAHQGFKRLAIDAEKEGRCDEAITLCETAVAQGWSGDWEKRIERCRKLLNA